MGLLEVLKAGNLEPVLEIVPGGLDQVLSR
jgi:hypothetical protein